MLYDIRVYGSEDDTYVSMELTDCELATVTRLANLVNEAQPSNFAPTIRINQR